MRTNKLLIFSVVVMSLVFVTCKERITVLPEKSKDKTITKVALNTSPKVTAMVDVAKKTITATVPFGTDLTKIILTITHSGTSIAPNPKTPQDFSNGKTIKYTVKAEDGSTQGYTVSITVKEPTVTFDTDGGNTIASTKVKKGEEAKAPAKPTKKGFKFVEWQLDGKTFDFNTTITKDIALKAIWVEALNATDWNTKDVTGGEVQILSYNGTDTKVVIPMMIDNKKVVALGNTILNTNIFNGSFRSPTTDIITIDISKAIYLTSIGIYAFSFCTRLTSISLPDALTSIGVAAFSYCAGLTSISLPNSVTSIGSSVFYYCTSLASIKIPDAVTSIGTGAFFNCSLTSITISESVTSIGTQAFLNNKITKVTLPTNCTYKADSFDDAVAVSGGKEQ